MLAEELHSELIKHMKVWFSTPQELSLLLFCGLFLSPPLKSPPLKPPPPQVTGTQATGTQAEIGTTTILQPVSVTSSYEGSNRGRIPRFAINQSGLRNSISGPNFNDPITYIHNETDFMEFTSIARHTSGGRNQFWESANNQTQGTLTFDLGEMFSINAIAIWNDDFLGAIRDFELFADNDNLFDNGGTTSLGTFTALRLSISTTNQLPIPAQPFFFDPVHTRYVHLDVISNHRGRGRSTLSEVAFGRSAIEVPFEYGNIPIAVLIVTVGGINYFQNKKKGRKDKE